MAIKLNGTDITSNRLNLSNITEEKLNGTKVWPTYQPAVAGTLIADVAEAERGYFRHAAFFNNPNPFPVKVTGIQYKRNWVISRPFEVVVPANAIVHQLYSFYCDPNYAFMVIAKQLWASEAGEDNGFNEVFEMEVRSSNYDEDETTTTTTR